MTKGIDANVDLTDHAGCLARKGFDFACRYLKHTSSCLTAAEARALSARGLSVVVVVEAGYPTSPAYFSRVKGSEDGAFAAGKARAIGIPPGGAIYFACDFDATLAAVKGPITDYFNAILTEFKAEHAEWAVGVYGSGLTCATLLRTTGVTYAWLAMSSGWRGSRSFTGWNIKQQAGGLICGVNADTDVSNGHGGGFKIG